MKRQACKRLLTAAVLCAALTVPTRAARRSVPVQIDGNPIAVSAYVERGRPMCPPGLAEYDGGVGRLVGRSHGPAPQLPLMTPTFGRTRRRIPSLSTKKLSGAGSRWKTALPMSLCGWWGGPWSPGRVGTRI